MLVTLALAACALPRPINQIESEIDGPSQSEKLEAVHTDLIRSMLNQAQYYAALAHIEDQENQRGPRPELNLLKAEALSMLGERPRAEQLYQRLLNSRFAGEAHHGLGLLYAQVDPRSAVGHLQQAVERRPTHAGFRSDLGYALLRLRQWPAARQQLSTAVELEPNVQKWRNNLLLVVMVQGDSRAIAQLSAGVPPATLDALRRQAASLAQQSPSANDQERS